MKSACNSPLLGDYLGTFSPKDFWVAMILRGKEIIVDHQGEEAKYPKQVPRIFRSAPYEDYRKEYCVSLCQQKRNISWEAIYNHQLNTCDIDNFVEDSLCSSDVCRDKTAFASTNVFVHHLRVDDTSLSVAQL